jgi:hypothetical protein
MMDQRGHIYLPEYALSRKTESKKQKSGGGAGTRAPAPPAREMDRNGRENNNEILFQKT